MSQQVETPTKTFTAGAALAKYRLVKLSAGVLAYAGAADTKPVGVLQVDALASGDLVAVRSLLAASTLKMVASEAITANAAVYQAANGKIASTGTVLRGVAMEAAAADGDVIEVMPSPAAILGDVARASLVQDDLAHYSLPLQDWRVTATGALLGATAGTPAGALGITYGTHGSAGPMLLGEAASNNSKTDKARLQFGLPPEYVAGETITVRVRCKETVGAATVSTTIDVECFKLDKDGGIGSDLCATAAQDVTTSVGNKDFTITPTGVVAGDVLDIELTGVTNDTGGAVGTILAIYDVEILLDIKG